MAVALGYGFVKKPEVDILTCQLQVVVVGGGADKAGVETRLVKGIVVICVFVSVVVLCVYLCVQGVGEGQRGEAKLVTGVLCVAICMYASVYVCSGGGSGRWVHG